MSENHLLFRVSVGWDLSTPTLEFAGEADDNAAATLLSALYAREPQARAIGLSDETDEWSGITLVWRGDDSDDDHTVFFHLSRQATLADLRLIIGNHDEHVAAVLGGFGGGDYEMVIWALEDLLPMGLDALEYYGAFEVARRLTRAMYQRKYRLSRAEAARWVRSGGNLTPPLLEVLNSRYSWNHRSIAAQLGIPDREAGDALRRAGFVYSPEDDAFYRPHDPDALN